MLNKCITKNNCFETDLYDENTINLYPTFAVCQTKCKTFHILNNFGIKLIAFLYPYLHQPAICLFTIFIPYSSTKWNFKYFGII